MHITSASPPSYRSFVGKVVSDFHSSCNNCSTFTSFQALYPRCPIRAPAFFSYFFLPYFLPFERLSSRRCLVPRHSAAAVSPPLPLGFLRGPGRVFWHESWRASAQPFPRRRVKEPARLVSPEDRIPRLVFPESWMALCRQWLPRSESSWIVIRVCPSDRAGWLAGGACANSEGWYDKSPS